MKPPGVPDEPAQRRINAPSHHRKPRMVPLGMAGIPEPPPELGDAAAQEWRRVLPSLVLLGAHVDLDRAVILAYCCAVGDLVELRAAHAAEGSPATVTRPSGVVREHPAVSLLRLLSADVLRYANALGMSPRSRKALDVQVGAVIAPEAAVECGVSPLASPTTDERPDYFS